MKHLKQFSVWLMVVVMISATFITSLPSDTFAEDSQSEGDTSQDVTVSQDTDESNVVTDTEEDEDIVTEIETNKDLGTDIEKNNDIVTHTEDTEDPDTTTDPITNPIYTYASIKNDTILYQKDKTTPVAQLKKSDVLFNIKKDEENSSFYIINWQGEDFFVKASDLDLKTSGTTVKEKSTIFTLTVSKDTTIYKNPSNSDVLAVLNEVQDLQIVGQSNGYYEIQIGGISAYIKKNSSYSAQIIKNGKLLDINGNAIGSIATSDTSFMVVPSNDVKKFQIEIGSTKYLIDASLLKLNSKVFKAPTSNRKEIVTLKAKTKIYADSSLQTSIFKINTTTKTTILGISGSNYKVKVGFAIGYVPMSSTTGQFTVKLLNNTPLYSDINKKTVVAKNASNTAVYTVSKTNNNNLFLIQIGSKNYYVKYSYLTFTNNNISTLKLTRKDTVTTKKGFVLYEKANTNTPLIKNGIANQKFVVQGTVGQYYIVHLGNKVAYLPAKYVTGIGANKEVTVKSTTLYKYQNKKYVAVGTVLKGYTFKSTSSNGTYYLFKKDNETFAIKKSAAIGSNKSVSLKTKAKATYPITLYAEKSAPVYNANGVQIGTINKGQSVALKGIAKNNKAIIDFMGQQAQVNFKDFYHKNIVNGASTISYGKMSYYVRVFALLYPEFTKQEVIGESVEGRKIYALRVGNGKKEILMDASFHAREHMTTNVLLKMIDSYSYAYRSNTKFNGWNVKSTLDKTSIWFLPMMNPDGVMLVQQGLNSLKIASNKKIAKQYSRNGSYKHWKANGRGVDLNRNFDGVNWYKQYKKKGSENYVGPSAVSEPESKAFVNFVNKHNFKSNISYHSSGQVIYWGGVQNSKELARDRKLVNQIANVTRYSPVKPWPLAKNYQVGSGNSTAWLIRVKRIPAITVEIAPYQGDKPVSLKEWSSIWNKNKTVGLIAAKEASSR